MHVTALILAAGKGERLQSKVPKPLVIIHSIPLLAYSLRVFDRHPGVCDILVAVNPDNRTAVTACIRKCRLRKPVRMVYGGARRQDSVLNALQAMEPRCEGVLIHDAARPFVDAATVSAVIKGLRTTGACICGVPAKATIKKVTMPHGRKAAGGFIVEETLDRKALWEIQTPQGFRKDILIKAYERCGDNDVTDDAALVEKSGIPVRVVEGSYRNIKITTPEDIIVARALAKKGNR